MVQIPRDFEDALDVCWAAYHNLYDSWKHVFTDTTGGTRNDVARELGWSYSTVHRLTEHLVKLGLLEEKWTHQHQSYWECHYKPK